MTSPPAEILGAAGGGLPMLRRLTERLHHWFTYQPERRYMRGGG